MLLEALASVAWWMTLVSCRRAVETFNCRDLMRLTRQIIVPLKNVWSTMHVTCTARREAEDLQ
jgi:hypothetical protein